MRRVFLNIRYRNSAEIESIMIRPYKGAKKELAYRMTLTDEDHTGFFVSVYETVEDAICKLGSFGGSDGWKELPGIDI